MLVRFHASRAATAATAAAVVAASLFAGSANAASSAGSAGVSPVRESSALTDDGLTLISAVQSTEAGGDPVINVLIQNTSGATIEFPGVLFAFYDKSGNQLGGVDDFGTTLHLLAPGERTGISDDALPAGYDHFKVLGFDGEPTSAPADHNFSVKFSGASPGADGGTLITGTITNRNTITADFVYVQLMFFDAAGNFLGAGPGGIDAPGESLAPGQSSTFSYDYFGAAYTTIEFTGEDGTTPVVPPSGCAGCAPFTRVSGSTRVDTAVAASKAQFAAGAAKAVVLARDDSFADALAGGPLAAHVGGPLLLTSPTGLDAQARAEIQRVALAGATVYILGGPAAIASPVDDQLASLGYVPDRIYGETRFATAVAIAHAMGDPTTIFEATGLNYPDALAGGPAAAAAGGAILLTNGSQQAPETAAYLAGLSASTRYALGGPAAHADPSASPIVGSDRFDTSDRIAAKFFPAATKIGIATAYNFPDALGAGPLLASQGAPLVLVPSSGVLSASTYEYLSSNGAGVTSGTVFGGTTAVSDEVVTCTQMDLAGSR